jgi:hypothetical protein
MERRLLAHGLLFLVVTAAPQVVATAIRVDVAAEETGTIEVRAVDAIAKPVPGVSVTIVPDSGGPAKRATTGNDGRCRFEVPGATYRIDFDILGFDLTRRNHVRVPNNGSTNAEGVLEVSGVCECVTIVPPNPLAVRSGEVIDTAGRPLPHARLEVVSPIGHEVAYADEDGRFLLKAPVDATWSVTVSDSGYRAVTQQVSGSVAGPIVFKLAYAGTTGVPDEESLSRSCRCPGDLFTHPGH